MPTNSCAFQIPLSLYIHIPWCVRKCPYCDFSSYSRPTNFDEAAYLSAVLADLQHERMRIAASLREPILTSIYIGGGTPTILSCHSIAQLMAKVYALFAPNGKDWRDFEITIEANPGTIDENYCKRLLEMGINRLSLGVQSLQDEKLHALGRIYDVETAQKSAALARNAGFTNINLDLMYGLPLQSVEDVVFDLQSAAALKPTHISWYQLTLEENTPWGKNPPASLPNSDMIWKMQKQGQKILSALGYKQYEVAAFCKQNYQCAHNINYWQFGDYLGVGAGAHGKLTMTAHDSAVGGGHKVKRYSKSILGWNNIDKHVCRTGECCNTKLVDYSTLAVKEELIARKDLPLEFMLNALRLYKPFSYRLFEERTGLPIATIEKELLCAAERGYIKLKADCITTTAHGKNFLNDLLEIFIK